MACIKNGWSLSEIWDSRTLVIYIWDTVTVDLVFLCTCLKMVTWKRLVVESEWIFLGLVGTNNTYMGNLGYIGSSYMAVRLRQKPNLFNWQVTKQIIKDHGPLCLFQYHCGFGKFSMFQGWFMSSAHLFVCPSTWISSRVKAAENHRICHLLIYLPSVSRQNSVHSKIASQNKLCSIYDTSTRQNSLSHVFTPLHEHTFSTSFHFIKSRQGFIAITLCVRVCVYLSVCLLTT